VNGPASSPSPWRRPKRGLGTAALVAAVVVLGGAALWVSLKIGRAPERRLATVVRPPAAPRSLGPEVESRIFQVAEASGRVEAFRDGHWIPISFGDVLTQEDQVRTGAGRAVLRFGSNIEVELRERVEVRLDSISRAGASLDLRRGRVVARVGQDGGKMTITAAKTRTENEGTTPSRFIVTADDRGRVAVAATEGSARFESAGRSVSVAAGTASHAEPDQAPADPEKISEDVFLSVVWPGGGDRTADKAPVSGRVDPGATVRINGAPADVDRGGRFGATVPLRDGNNAVEVEVEDAAGRVKRDKRDIRKVSLKPPDLQAEPTELWKQ
jgi:hypothetical protein